MTKFNFNNFPNELKGLNQWVTWKSKKAVGVEKHKKIPCDPRTGNPIDSLKQLYSYTEACQYTDCIQRE